MGTKCIEDNAELKKNMLSHGIFHSTRLFTIGIDENPKVMLYVSVLYFKKKERYFPKAAKG